MQIYRLNIFLSFVNLTSEKNVFVDVSCIIKCDKSFLFNRFLKIKVKSYFCKLYFVLQMSQKFLFLSVFAAIALE
jgi:hypothetical protein